jgi:small GTP-binding protein
MAEDNSIINYKFALLGDSSVGKTSIFKKISTGEFFLENISTIGTDKKSIEYNDIEIEINGKTEKKSFLIELFDTAGQERYRSITKNYIKGSDGIILIYDITNKETFEHVEKWLTSIKDVLSDWKASNYLIMLLGNKLDLIDIEEYERKVEIDEAKNKCDDNEIHWGGECSAKDFTDSQFIDLFKNFTISIYKKNGAKTVKKQNSKIIGRYKKKRIFC